MFILKSVSEDSDWSMVHLFYKDPTLSFQFPFAFVFYSIYDKNLHIRCTPWSVFQDGVILSILIMS